MEIAKAVFLILQKLDLKEINGAYI